MKVGILGCGTIVPGFLEAGQSIYEFQAISGLENDIPNMKKLAEAYGIKNIYTNADDLLADDIDIVYCALPNSLHYAYGLKAIEAGKNVIMEKPFASNINQAKELIEKAKEKGIYIFEAITNQYLPNYQKVKELLPELGDIKIVQLNYSQYSRRYDAFKQGVILPVFDINKAGGALMDLNVYNIHFVTGLFGKPTDVQYFANIERGVDTSGILTLSYPTFKCVLVAAKDCKAPVEVNIQGDKGFIHSDVPANVFSAFRKESNEGEKKEFALNSFADRMYYELKTFADWLEAKDTSSFDKMNEHTLVVMDIIDQARKFAGIKIVGE